MSSFPGPKHKVIGLVSGGKDSCFNLMYTVANGHELVGLATLTPPAGTDELDSHMYQSVGTSLPPLIARAMGLPHYSRVITGGALEQGAEYGSREGREGREGDETEDLTALLRDVMTKHPEATAISSGAILSNYQRLRIEHVCGRLGLTSLAYLWQSEQLPLVEQMVASGLEAVLVKVAGVGLTTKCLGKSLGQLYPLLSRLQAQYGAHPAGEGGEYETLTLDTPLFSHRIAIGRAEVVVTDPEPSLVAYLRIEEAELEPKEGWTRPTVPELRELLGLDEEEGMEGLDEESVELLESLDIKSDAGDASVGKTEITSQVTPSELSFGRRGSWFAISGSATSGESVGDELRSLFDSIKSRLSSEGLSLTHAAHLTLLLSSMSDFSAANAAYISYFGVSPPSRACVALQMGERLRVEIVGCDAPARSALHVQGVSYWAPANIGPYSQAVTADSRLHIAGQIALHPPSLTITNASAAHQSVLALQHVRRILSALRDPNATGGGWTGWLEGCTAWWTRDVDAVREAWKRWSLSQDCGLAPVVFVRAAELPRGAAAEFQVNVHTGRESSGDGKRDGEDEDDDDDSDDDEATSLRPVYSSGTIPGAYWEACRAPRRRSGARAAVFLTNSGAADVPDLADILARAVCVRVYHSAPLDYSPLRVEAPTTFVPVLEVRDRLGKLYPSAVEVFAA